MGKSAGAGGGEAKAKAKAEPKANADPAKLVEEASQEYADALKTENVRVDLREANRKAKAAGPQLAGSRDKSIKGIDRFKNRLKAFKGESEMDAVLKDLNGVDASKYVPEIADCIMEAASVTLKLKELPAACKVCSQLLATYEDFAAVLAKSVKKAYDGTPSTDMNRRRFLFRLCAELCLVECTPSAGKELHDIVKDLCDVGVAADQLILNFTVISSLAQKHAASCFGVVPSRQKSLEQALGRPWVERQCVLREPLQLQLQHLAVNAYKSSAAGLLQGAHARLAEQEKLNAKLRIDKGQVDAENQQKHNDLKESFTKLQGILSTLSEHLNQPMPSSVEEDTGVSRIGRAEKKKDEDVKVDESDIWELSRAAEVRQEASRSNYEDLYDLKDMIPAVQRKSGKSKAPAETPAASAASGEGVKDVKTEKKKEDQKGKPKDVMVQSDFELNLLRMSKGETAEQIDELVDGVPQPSISICGPPAAPGDAAQALKPVLDPFDVDEDTFESLRDMVKEAFEEHGAGGSGQLAPQLEELLEPFLLAFGAEPTAVPGAALQVAVSLCGLPELASAAKPAAPKPPPAAPEPTAATAAERKRPLPTQANAATAEAARKLAAGGGFTLEAFCAGGSSGSRANPKAKAKAFAPAQRGGDGAPPMTLSGLWKTEVDTNNQVKAAWDLGQGAAEGGGDGFVLQGDSEGSDKEDEDGAPDEDQAREQQARERKQRKETSRSQRLAMAEARANAAPMEDLATVASLGLSETREGRVEPDKKKRPGKAPHMEGAGGRNVHLEGINVTLNGPSGSVDLLKEADVHLSAGHVYGLVGKNGCGKTTFLRRLATGAVPGLPPHLRFRYMAQELSCLNLEQSPLEAVVHSDEERRDLLEERDKLDALLSAADQASSAEAQRFLEVERCLEAIDADGAEDRAKEMLQVFNFDDATMRQPTGILSGGWQMRLALAIVLFSRPDVLLLDEPTNHLDLHGVLWLQKHLRCEWGGSSVKKDRIVMVVSHDRSFLDACATDILEIHSCKLRNFAGNYSAYLERVLDEQRIVLLRKEQDERSEKVAEQELRAMKKKAREHKDDKKVRQLKAKEKVLTERKVKLSSAREFGEGGDDILTKLREDTNLRFRFPEADNVLDADTNYLEMDGATIRQGDRVILKKVTLTIEPRSRIAIVGANGAGKSTLMKALCGELKANEGPRGRGKTHPAFKPAFVSQNHLERFEGSLRANCVDHLREQLPDANTLKGSTEGMLTKQCDDSLIRAALGNFGMGRDALKKVGYLSGGQRARLSLATATWWEPTALLLDEPTNHLDVDSLDALTLGLQAFDGPVVVVSHSRGFLEALCEELWIVKDGTVQVCPKGDEAFAQFFAQYVKQVEASLK